MDKQKIIIRSTLLSGIDPIIPEYPEGLFPIDFPNLDAFKSIDLQLHNFLLNEFTDKIGSVDRIFIPLSLTDDYLNFTGIRLAIHIRLTSELKDISHVPIFLMGYESKEDVCKYSNLGFFLFSKGVYLIKESNEEIESNLPPFKEGVTESYITTELPQKIILAPPDFYDNRHSITNEWALLLMDAISGHNILKKKPELQEIQSNLYIKWLITQKGIGVPNNNSSKEKYLIPNAEGKRILLIDDEWNKGWLELFRAFCEHNKNNTVVDYVHIEKKSTEAEIINSLKNKLEEEEDWDLFLLDIRLTDDDQGKKKDYTGFKALNAIMEANGGNQVILMSASNKHPLYEYGLRLGAAGGFIKPDLESSLKLSDLNLLLNTPIEKCFKKGYLKSFYRKISLIRSLLSDYPFNDGELFKKFILDCNSILDVGFELLSKAYQKKEFLRYTYLQLFTIIESFVSLEEVFKVDYNAFVIIDNSTEVCVLKAIDDKAYESALSWKSGNYKLSRSTYSRRIDTNFKVASLLIFKYGLSTSGEKNWTKVNTVRNDCAHENFYPTLENIKDLIRFLIFIFDRSNINEKNIGKGLSPPSYEDSLDRLKRNWGI